MGNKVSPLIIRPTNTKTDWYNSTQQTSYFFLLKNYLFNFFYKKGLLINNFLIKKNDEILYINLDFFISKTSSVYTKKFRKNLKRYKKKKKKNNKNNFKTFLIVLSKLYQVKKLYIKFTRIDIRLPYRLLNILLRKGNKIGLKKQLKKNILLKDFVLLSTFLITNTQTKINIKLIALIIAKYFTWLPKRQQKRFLIFLRDYFKLIYRLDKLLNNKLEGIKFLVSGKIAGKTKASNFKASIGNLFIQTITKPVNFTKTTSYTKTGTYGWKLWVTEKTKL